MYGLQVAPVPGLEPGTRGLTVHCSNQLSYTGKIFFFRGRNLYKVYNIKKNFSIYLKNQILALINHKYHTNLALSHLFDQL